MIKNYEDKFEYIYERQKGRCAISNQTKKYKKNMLSAMFHYKFYYIGISKITELHHRCHKEKWRVKKFPLFIDSMLNLVGVNHWEHIKNPSALSITDVQAEKYEKFLEKDMHKKCRDFVNMKKR
jgi:hypothetical protein